MNAPGESAWMEPALNLAERGERSVLVTVAQARGSTPREAGTKMLVWSDGIAGTVGGGHLEFKAIACARAMIRDTDAQVARIDRFSLGPELAQCCGGGAALLFEPLSAASTCWIKAWAHMEQSGAEYTVITKIGSDSDAKTFLDSANPSWDAVPAAIGERARTLAADGGRCVLVELLGSGDRYLIEAIRPLADHLYLFGAGHVGRAVARALEPLPFRVTWIDSRENAFPDRLPRHIVTVPSSAPPVEVDGAPMGTFFLVMTHSHPLDLEICARVLERSDFAYLGLIGSETKRARFAGRLRAIGIPPQALARLTCPIGIPGIAGKEPATIAASVAAQLLIVAEHRRQAAGRPAARAVGSGT
jgi:xanthine dehydrogenase accessory factor